MDPVVVTTYRCTKCKAEDRDRSERGATPPIALNCWKCHAGKGLDLSAMIQRQIGMFPITA